MAKSIHVSTQEKRKYLLPIGDLHYGHPATDVYTFKGYLEWARENNAWILLMGDLIENGTRASVGAAVYEQIANPQQQMTAVKETLEPYKDLILGALTGNHEERTVNMAGYDPTEDLCQYLRVPYLKYGAFLRLVVGSQGYTVYATHGSSGSAKLAGKINAAHSLALMADADLYLMGHVHELHADHKDRSYFNTKSKSISKQRQTFVLTGHFLGWWDTYSQKKNYAPGKIGAPRIFLDGTKSDLHVSI